MLTQAYLQSRFIYDPRGFLLWKTTRFKNRLGKRVGGFDKRGRRRVYVAGREYKEHQLVLAFFTGRIPKIIDHANRNQADNRIENLRSATASQSASNCVRKNRLVFRGVKQSSKNVFTACIRKNGKQIRLGYFKTVEEAAKAYNKSATKIYGAFAVLNEM